MVMTPSVRGASVFFFLFFSFLLGKLRVSRLFLAGAGERNRAVREIEITIFNSRVGG